MTAPASKFEAAIALSAAVERNQREALYFKHRLDGIADAANTLGLDVLSKTLFSLATEIAERGAQIAAAHKAAHLVLVGAALDPLP